MIEVFKKFPRNKFDFEGAIVLYSKNLETFYRISFGCGDNLMEEDRAEGYDDYLLYDAYSYNPKCKYTIEEMKGIIKYNDGYLDTIHELVDEDGGMMLVKRSDYMNSGDIRDYLENALDMAGVWVTETYSKAYDVIAEDAEDAEQIAENLAMDDMKLAIPENMDDREITVEQED
ncbi:unnamed protein product [Cylicocyclus nassatus]|uniref:Uncharacterized protein n=1 Tax=Cylicocyclus nassatus TaxID=53992 RepID=A0AA36DRK3_CYLNA|nr:unnamed protein product [Cylicocyclus nassatus]